MSILVVDDNTMLLSKIVKSLLKANHTVLTATSIAKTREILQQENPQVLCLDLQLPDGNGLDLIQELRESKQKIPVVIISGHYSEENRERAKCLEVDGFFSKPFVLQDLHKLLDRLLDKTDVQKNDTKVNLQPVSVERITQAKRAYTTRNVPIETATHLICENYQPQVGDLLLAKVDKRNQHTHIQLPTGRRALMFPDDEIIICYGNRYAPDQFEAEVPDDLSPCHLVAAGGIASKCLSRNNNMKPATRISPVGVLADYNGRALNLGNYGIQETKSPVQKPAITVVVGTSMNAGKTTVAADLILGMKRKGMKVGAANVTGTGAGGDIWRMVDAGCHKVVDFTDFGVPSTYKVTTETCVSIMETLIAHLCKESLDSIVIEVADGILQTETRGLIQSDAFAELADNIIFAAADAMGAISGVTWLQEQGLNVVGISGVLTSSPLAVRECAHGTQLPIYHRNDLSSGRFLHKVLGLNHDRLLHSCQNAG